MIISYLKRRLNSEPIILLTNLYDIKHTKALSLDNVIRLFRKDDNIELQGFVNIWNYLIKNRCKSDYIVSHDHDQDMNPKLPLKIYILLSDYLNENKIDDDILASIKTLLNDTLKMISTNGFMNGNSVSPSDILLYETIMTINDLGLFKLDDQFIKYTNRLESQEFMNEYIFTDEYINKNFKPNQLSKHNNRKITLYENLNKLWDFAQMIGCLYSYRRKNDNGDEVKVTDHVPISCMPFKISHDEFNELHSTQKIWNELINQLARDYEWYSDCLSEVAKVDDFIGNLLKISKKCKEYPHTQQIYFDIFRNDFMYHSNENRWIQVEYNTIAASFGCMSDRVQNFHKRLIKYYFPEENLTPLTINNEKMIVEAISEAFRLYNNKKAKVLMVVTKIEGSIFERRYMELGLLDNDIHSIAMDLEMLYSQARLDDETGKLFINNQEIAVVYYKAGYGPEDYPTDKEWKARELIELSKAIKCPNIDLQLVGFKKFQYYLCEDKNLQSKKLHLMSKGLLMIHIKSNQLRKTLQNFDDESLLPKLKEITKANPNGFVLKPQREGGGNNIYGLGIVEELNKKTPEELKSYILMQRINPIPYLGFLMTNRKLEIAPVINELGLFGYIISTKEKIIKNEVGGYLLRTKKASSNEGGVAAGYGVIDSLVIQQKQCNLKKTYYKNIYEDCLI